MKETQGEGNRQKKGFVTKEEVVIFRKAEVNTFTKDSEVSINKNRIQSFVLKLDNSFTKMFPSQ